MPIQHGREPKWRRTGLAKMALSSHDYETGSFAVLPAMTSAAAASIAVDERKPQGKVSFAFGVSGMLNRSRHVRIAIVPALASLNLRTFDVI